MLRHTATVAATLLIATALNVSAAEQLVTPDSTTPLLVSRAIVLAATDAEPAVARTCLATAAKRPTFLPGFHATFATLQVVDMMTPRTATVAATLLIATAPNVSAAEQLVTPDSTTPLLVSRAIVLAATDGEPAVALTSLATAAKRPTFLPALHATFATLQVVDMMTPRTATVAATLLIATAPNVSAAEQLVTPDSTTPLLVSRAIVLAATDGEPAVALTSLATAAKRPTFLPGFHATFATLQVVDMMTPRTATVAATLLIATAPNVSAAEQLVTPDSTTPLLVSRAIVLAATDGEPAVALTSLATVAKRPTFLPALHATFATLQVVDMMTPRTATVAATLLIATAPNVSAAEQLVTPDSTTPLLVSRAIVLAATDGEPAVALTSLATVAKRPTFLPALYATFATLQVMDMMTTRTAVAAGHREMNPLMRGNMGTSIALKAASATATFYLTERLWKKNRVAAIVVMTAINVTGVAVVAHNHGAARR